MGNLPNGPYQTAEEVLALPSVQAVHEGFRSRPGQGRMAPLTMEKILLPACEAAGVELGTRDREILKWLSTFGPEESAVIAGLITRAAAGKPDGDGPRCGLCGGLAEARPDPYMTDRMLWRHAGLPRKVVEFLDAEHEALPADAPELFAGIEDAADGDR